MKNEATPARKFKFPKSERLHSRKLIQLLFDQGSSFFLYPFKVFHLPNPEEVSSHQVLVTTSAKKYKKAVERNLIKRRIREAYRLNKHYLSEEIDPNINLLIAYIYVGKEILPYEVMEVKLKESFTRLKSRYRN